VDVDHREHAVASDLLLLHDLDDGRNPLAEIFPVDPVEVAIEDHCVSLGPIDRHPALPVGRDDDWAVLGVKGMGRNELRELAHIGNLDADSAFLQERRVFPLRLLHLSAPP